VIIVVVVLLDRLATHEFISKTSEEIMASSAVPAGTASPSSAEKSWLPVESEWNDSADPAHAELVDGVSGCGTGRGA
jgi:hypothetical protein